MERVARLFKSFAEADAADAEADLRLTPEQRISIVLELRERYYGATVALTMSGEQFDALPNPEGRNWELLAGELVEMHGATWKHQMIVLAIAASLRMYFRQTANGGAAPDVEFAMEPNVRLRPNVAILLGEKWRELNAEKTPVSGAPDIAVEVISPGEMSVQSFRKVRTYLRHGVREVWQVYPTEESVLIHTDSAPIATVGLEGKLTSELLPAWELPVAEFLEPTLRR